MFIKNDSPPKQEPLIFSSSPILKGEIMRTSHILIKVIQAWSPPNKIFSPSHHVNRRWNLPFFIDMIRRWEVLVWGTAIFDRHEEKMRSSCLGGFKLQLTWWEVFIISPFKIWPTENMRKSHFLGLRFLTDIMRRWEVLIWGASSFNYLDENMKSSDYLTLQGLTWWEDEKFSCGGLLFLIDMMRRWEVLVWGASSFN